MMRYDITAMARELRLAPSRETETHTRIQNSSQVVAK